VGRPQQENIKKRGGQSLLEQHKNGGADHPGLDQLELEDSEGVPQKSNGLARILKWPEGLPLNV
jgi:hypothetical protein